MRQSADTSETRVPATFMLHSLRPSFHRLVAHRWQLEVFGEQRVPATGPVIFAANHIGWLDGPLLAIVSPRPAHVLTKREMYKGPMSIFLSKSGQIPLNRVDLDLQAIRDAAAVLHNGGAIGIFPEGVRGGGDVQHAKGGAAYLALRTGAKVVPVGILGTRAPGAAKGYIPPRGTRIAMGFGDPLSLPPLPWPRKQEAVAEVTDRIRQALIATVAETQTLTGLELPGPLTEVEDE